MAQSIFDQFESLMHRVERTYGSRRIEAVKKCREAFGDHASSVLNSAIFDAFHRRLRGGENEGDEVYEVDQYLIECLRRWCDGMRYDCPSEAALSEALREVLCDPTSWFLSVSTATPENVKSLSFDHSGVGFVPHFMGRPKFLPLTAESLVYAREEQENIVLLITTKDNNRIPLAPADALEMQDIAFRVARDARAYSQDNYRTVFGIRDTAADEFLTANYRQLSSSERAAIRLAEDDMQYDGLVWQRQHRGKGHFNARIYYCANDATIDVAVRLLEAVREFFGSNTLTYLNPPVGTERHSVENVVLGAEDVRCDLTWDYKKDRPGEVFAARTLMANIVHEAAGGR